MERRIKDELFNGKYQDDIQHKYKVSIKDKAIIVFMSFMTIASFIVSVMYSI